MSPDNYDEEGLLKTIRAFEISAQITKLNWNWKNCLDPVKLAHVLVIQSQNLFLEISEYEQRMGSQLSEYQRKEIDKSVDNLVKLIPYIKNKIEPSISLENRQFDTVNHD